MSEPIAKSREELALRLKDVVPRTFDYKGLRVDEFLVPWDGGKTKVIWVLSGLLGTVQDSEGKPVPISHSEFVGGGPKKVAERVTRRRVCQVFNEHYFPNTNPAWPEGLT